MPVRARFVGSVLVSLGLMGGSVIGLPAPAHADTNAIITAPDTIAPGVRTPARVNLEIVPPTDPGDLPLSITVSASPSSPSATGLIGVYGFWDGRFGVCEELTGATAIRCAWPGDADGQTDYIRLTLTATADASGPFTLTVAQTTLNSEREELIGQEITVGEVADAIVELNLRTTADQQVRPGPSYYSVSCFSGDVVPVVVPSGETDGTSGPVSVTGNTQCIVQGTGLGVIAGVELTSPATIMIDGGPAIPYVVGDEFIVPAGGTIVIDVVNEFTLRPDIPVPPVPAPPAAGEGILPATGPNAGLRIGVLIAGAGAVITGIILVVVTRRLRRTG